MWFSLFTSILILAVTFYQGLQGLFSSLITCILTVLSAALAFGYFEDLYFGFLVGSQPDHGRALALVGLFVITLLVLRTIFDSLIVGNMQFPLYVDRAGGGVFGFVTAMIIVGMLTLGFQMLPFGSSFLGFTRYALVDEDSGQAIVATDPTAIEWENVKHVRQKTWLQPGGFTVGLASHLSANALRGSNNFAEVYPDYLAYIHRSKVNPLGKSRMAVEPDALIVSGYWDLRPNEFFAREPLTKDNKKFFKLKPAGPADPGLKRWAVRVSIDPKAKDSDNVFRFTPEQFRLLARDRKDGPLREYFLAGISEIQPPARGKLVEVYLGEGIARQADGPKLETDLVFAVPDSTDFQPVMLEFKQNARAEITPAHDLNKNPPTGLTGAKPAGTTAKPGAAAPPGLPAPPSTPLNSSGSTSATPNLNQRPKDRVSGIGEIRKETTWSNELPFELTEYTGIDLEKSSDGAVLGGRVFATLDQNWAPLPGSKPPINKFSVPQGRQFLQLSVEKLQPGSWLGNIYGGIIDTIGDFYIIDQSRQNFKPVGAYAMATVSGKNVFELVFLNDVARDADRGLPKFQSIKPRDLEGDYSYYFLFYLPPKTKPVELHTGRRSIDLTPFNLEAPDEIK